MSFLKTLFWIVVAVVVALFCVSNWTLVGVKLWNGMILETKLPLLLGFFFLLGLVPPLLLWQATRYRLRRTKRTQPLPSPAPVPTQEPMIAPAGPYTPVPPGGA